jgi:cytochrome b561
MQLLASALHWVLYGFMIVMPILGWLAVSAKGNSVLFYGIELPPLIAPNHPLVKSLEAIHSLLGTVGYFLIGIHAAAGLYHHYVVRDNTLLRIWPKRG